MKREKIQVPKGITEGVRATPNFDRILSPDKIGEAYQTYDNPRKVEIPAAKQGMEFIHLYSTYSDSFFCDRDPKDVKYLSKKLKGKVVVDLGCGEHLSNISVLAAQLGASVYIGVDITAHSTNYLYRETRVLVKNSDMLEFASKLPTGSVNFVLNGIDFLYGEYLDLLIAEIRRATEKRGIVFGRGSEPIMRFLGDSGELKRKEDIFKLHFDHFLFEKKY